MAAENLPASAVWSKTVDLVKDRVNNRSLWETMEQAVGITIEDNTFIIGLPVRIFNLASHLTVSDHRNAIEQSLSQVAGRRLDFRVVEGTTLDDWTAARQREARMEAMRRATYDRRDKREVQDQSWDALHEHVQRTYSALTLRSLPQTKARFLEEMLATVCDSMETLYPDQPDELTERHLSRVIEKIAGSAEVPATIVALELERLRAYRKQNPESGLTS